jgi:hypothetical protein
MILWSFVQNFSFFYLCYITEPYIKMNRLLSIRYHPLPHFLAAVMNSACYDYRWQHGDSLVCNYIASAVLTASGPHTRRSTIDRASYQQPQTCRKDVRGKKWDRNVYSLRLRKSFIKTKNLLLVVPSTGYISYITVRSLDAFSVQAWNRSSC